MSPATFRAAPRPAVVAQVDRLWHSLGERVRDARLARRWTTARLAAEAGVSRSLVYLVERGERTSLETAVRLASALRLRLDLDLIDPARRGAAVARPVDPVHAAMAEMEAAHIRAPAVTVAIDEPYQHYHFAGRADLVAWRTDQPALLHLENRTRFPDMQSMAGSWNAKRAYLAADLAARLGIQRWTSVTHAMVALWSSEVLHAVRLRTETFRSLCPDPIDDFSSWWSGNPPSRGTSATFVLMDPFATPRQRLFLALEKSGGARPRVHGYAEAVERLRKRERGRDRLRERERDRGRDR